MTDEELLSLEREGIRIAQQASDAMKEVGKLCAGSKEGAVAVLTGYLRYLLEEMPNVDPEEAVRGLVQSFHGKEDWADAILDRLIGQEFEKGASS